MPTKKWKIPKYLPSASWSFELGHYKTSKRRAISSTWLIPPPDVPPHRLGRPNNPYWLWRVIVMMVSVNSRNQWCNIKQNFLWKIFPMSYVCDRDSHWNVLDIVCELGANNLIAKILNSQNDSIIGGWHWPPKSSVSLSSSTWPMTHDIWPITYDVTCDMTYDIWSTTYRKWYVPGCWPNAEPGMTQSPVRSSSSKQ